MTEVKNLYLNECPVKYKKELKKVLGGVYEWRKCSNIKKTEYPVNAVRIKPHSEIECSCHISRIRADISLQHSQHNLSSPNGNEYECQIKIWDNPAVAKILRNYFAKKKMLVDIVNSDV